MKSKWVFHQLNSRHPSLSSLFSPLKTKTTSQHPYSSSAKHVLNHVQISHLLSVSAKDGQFYMGPSLHAFFVKGPQYFDVQNQCNIHNVAVIWNSLLSLYTKCGPINDAVKLFDEMPIRDTVSWNIMISGFLRDGDFDTGFGYFKRLLELGFDWLDQASFTTMLSACDIQEYSFVTKIIHCLVVLSGYEQEVTVGNALITSYFKCGSCGLGRQVFGEMRERNVITWTAVISGLVQNQLYDDSLKLFAEMRCGSVNPNFLTYLSSLMACSGLQALREGRQIHGILWKLGSQSDVRIESALMDMYSKCGSVEDAWRVFESAEELDEVSMTVILVGFAQNKFEDEAIQFFVKMVKAGIEIDPNMVSAVLGVFGVDTSLGLGKQIHSVIVKRGFTSNPFVSNGLINMYSKCGDLKESIKVFSRMSDKNSISWNTMIAAFARHGNGSRALELYEEMRLEGIKPTDVTFLSLLHACSHVGLVEKGMEFFKSMTEVHKISPRTEHYACVVDMLGRAGLLNEAKSFIEGLPVKPDLLVWQALLGACSIHGDSEMGKYAADQLILAAPNSPAPYILLANIYSSKGRWRERARTIRRMKEMGVDKETGISWIEIENAVHSFVVDDRSHPNAEIIYEVLAELFRHMIDEGYQPDKRFIQTEQLPPRLHHQNLRKKMEHLCLNSSLPLILSIQKAVAKPNRHNFPSHSRTPLRCPSKTFTVRNSKETTGDSAPPSPLSSSSAYAILGVEPSCSAAELKAAFRSKVKQYHPDLNRDGKDSDSMIRLVIQAYEMLSEYSRSEIIERECLDPFDDPECEAFDIFVNEVLCVGRGCPYSCVKTAPHAFTYVSSTGTARATSQGHGEDYQVQLAVGQCPRSCIHYVTPSQRIILEELLESILNVPYDISAEADLLYSLITKAKFENNRYQKPKKQPKTSSKHVDWF
ncbi:pentatricopeptide repeat-containing protein At3g05340-like [Pistacia vera]|uniref:pentatricopeptide repeat-containing protein At3g05340-like n=1 Tax=Pistacia vera TaxID=55513 RepID=UPI0012638FA1|nr:pentatricopeptide repeat-containing protein At3g05340-like [Pistacia vera]